MAALGIGTRVRVRGVFLDAELREPLTGNVVDEFWRPDWRTTTYCVMFDHGDPGCSPGGEFPAAQLELWPNGS